MNSLARMTSLAWQVGHLQAWDPAFGNPSSRDDDVGVTTVPYLYLGMYILQLPNESVVFEKAKSQQAMRSMWV